MDFFTFFLSYYVGLYTLFATVVYASVVPNQVYYTHYVNYQSEYDHVYNTACSISEHYFVKLGDHNAGAWYKILTKSLHIPLVVELPAYIFKGLICYQHMFLISRVQISYSLFYA